MDEEQMVVSELGEEVLKEFGDVDPEEAVGIALGDSLIDDAEAFAMITDLNDSRWAVKFLIKEHVPLVEVVRRCLHSMFAEQLINYVVAKHARTIDFLPFLIRITSQIPEDQWTEHDLGDFYHNLVDRRNNLEVKYFLTKGDYRRAWDEVRRARNAAQSFHGKGGSKIERLRELVHKVYGALVEAGEIRSVTDNDRLAQNYTRAGRHAIGNRPGWEFACELGIKQSDTHAFKFDLSVEGAMVLSIATYFNAKRNERRQQKALEAIRKKEDEMDDLDNLPSYYPRKPTR